MIPTGKLDIHKIKKRLRMVNFMGKYRLTFLVFNLFYIIAIQT